MKHQSI
jgi:hypothetical protein